MVYVKYNVGRLAPPLICIEKQASPSIILGDMWYYASKEHALHTYALK